MHKILVAVDGIALLVHRRNSAKHCPLITGTSIIWRARCKSRAFRQIEGVWAVMWARFGQFLSVDFLSAIFGILGKFRIYIGKNIFYQLFFSIWKKSRQKSRKYFSRLFEKFRWIFIFSMENVKLSFKIFPLKIWHFPLKNENSSKFFKKSRKIFFSTFVEIFFISKKKVAKKYFYLYQSEIFPGFQKSHL